MASPNIILPTGHVPILHASHHRTGDAWCIYPCTTSPTGSRLIEGITHSLCSLEYEIHRPLYDWFLDELEIYHPRQIECARLNVSYTVLSKRTLLKTESRGARPRLGRPPHAHALGLRRRGTQQRPSADFCERIGRWPRRTAR